MSLITTELFNIDILNFLNSLNLQYFKGVFSSDNIPRFTDDFVLICNLSNMNEPGTHFIAISKIQNTLTIFDPLALHLMNRNLQDVIAALKRKCEHLIFMQSPVQPLASHGCGMYCIFFVLLYHTSIMKNTPTLIPFQSNDNLNDSICIRNVLILYETLQ